MIIKLEPINDDNRDAVLALSVREDQPFVATNEVSLRQADDTNAEQPGVARPFAIYADEKLVGFSMFVFNPEDEDEDDRYWLWRFMIDRNEQGKGVTPRLRRIRPYGKQYMYSGGGITLAELAFTRITGTTLREAFQKEVAEPLGLKRTGFFQPLDEELVGGAAFGGRLAEKEDPAHGYHYYPAHAAAGLWATPTELVKIGLALSESYRKGGLLKKKTARRMMTPVMDDYGLCLDVWESEARGDSVAGHTGENWGFLTSWIFSRKKDICVAIMYNNVTEAADEAMDDIACEIYKNAKK